MTYREVYSPETNQFRWIFRQDCCRHCPDPFCKIGCPVNDVKATDPGNEGKTVSVITKNEEIGAVIYNNRYCDFQNTDKEGKEHCCQECIRACPYNVPRFEFDPETKKEFRRAYKCTLCIDRLTQLDESHQLNEVDRIPACVKTCAAKGLQFGDRDAVLNRVHERVEELRPKYPDVNIYPGEGYNVIWILTELPGIYDLAAVDTKQHKLELERKYQNRMLAKQKKVDERPERSVADLVSGPVKVASTIAGGALLGIYKLAERKKKIQAEEPK